VFYVVGGVLVTERVGSVQNKVRMYSNPMTTARARRACAIHTTWGHHQPRDLENAKANAMGSQASARSN